MESAGRQKVQITVETPKLAPPEPNWNATQSCSHYFLFLSLLQLHSHARCLTHTHSDTRGLCSTHKYTRGCCVIHMRCSTDTCMHHSQFLPSYMYMYTYVHMHWKHFQCVQKLYVSSLLLMCMLQQYMRFLQIRLPYVQEVHRITYCIFWQNNLSPLHWWRLYVCSACVSKTSWFAAGFSNMQSGGGSISCWNSTPQPVGTEISAHCLFSNTIKAALHTLLQSHFFLSHFHAKLQVTTRNSSTTAEQNVSGTPTDAVSGNTADIGHHIDFCCSHGKKSLIYWTTKLYCV